MRRHNRNFSFLAFLLSVALSAVQILPVYGQETEPEETTTPEVVEQGSSDDDPQEPVNTTDPPAPSDSSSSQDESTNPNADAGETSADASESDPSLPAADQNEEPSAKTPPEKGDGESETPQYDLNPRTLTAEEGALKLSVTGVFKALPEAVSMKIEKIPANEETEKKLTSSLFAKDEKVSFYGFRITWVTADGEKITPEDPVFTLDYDLSEAGISEDAVTSSILQEKDGEALVISDESSGLTQTSQTLHAEFSALNLEKLYVATIQSAQELSEAAAIQPETESAPEKAEPEEDSDSDEAVKDEQTVYCYTVVPGVKVTPYGNCDSEWNGMGIGLANGVPEAHYVSFSSNVNYLDNPGVSVITPNRLPDISPNSRYPDSYPPITASADGSGDTKVYQYAAPGSGKEHTYGYYTIDWDQLVMSDGANSGHNGYNPTISYYQPTWHLNGVVYLNQEQYVSIGFYLKDAGSNAWQNISAIRTLKGTTEKKILESGEVPHMDDSHYPEYKTVNGIVYHLVFWSDSQDMSDLHNLDQDVPIEENTAFYAAYIPEPSKSLKVTKQVEGEFADPDQQFEFRMKVAWKNEAWLPSSADMEKYGITGSNGEYSFYLKAGQSLSLQVPENASVSIEEILPENSGYISEASRNGAPPKEARDAFELAEDTNIVFTNTRQSWNVFFKFKDLGQISFKEIGSAAVPADTATGAWLENQKQVPSLSEYPKIRVQDGQIYHLVSWSENEELQNPEAISGYGKLHNNETFYAGYLPVSNHWLTIRKTVAGGGADPDQEYHFEVSLSYENEPFDLNEKQLTQSGWTGSDGKYSFVLKANEQSSIQLPEGVHIHIDEQNEESEGFASTILADGKEQQDPYEAEITQESLVEYHNEKQQWTVDFEFREAGSSAYRLLRSVQVPAATSTEQDLLNKNQVPDLSDCPERTIKDGIAYHLVYWSENQNLENPTDLKNSTLLKDHEVFYAGYLPENSQQLTILKTVNGQMSDPDRSFDFTIRLFWEDIPYELTEDQLVKTGWQKTGEGEYSFSLKNNESDQISLPQGTRVDIEEADESKLGFETSVLVNGQKAEESSPFSLEQDSEIQFINEKQDWNIRFFFRDAGHRDWKLLKRASVPADTSTEQTLLNTNQVPDLSGYPETEVVDGMVYHLRFWSESRDLTDLTNLKNSDPLHAGEDFYAGYVADEVKTLSINKKVSGQHFEDRDYQFVIYLEYQGQPFELSDSELSHAGWTKEEPGVYTVSLKENETSTAYLPAGIAWEIEEADYSQLGYSTSVNNADSRKAEGVLEDSTSALFTNTKQQWSVDFMFKNPNEDWKLMKQVSVPAETSTLKTLLDNNKIPSLAAKPKTMVKNGVVYDLKTWSETESLSDPVDFGDDIELRNKEVFYAGYIPRATHPLNIKKTVRGEGANPDNEYTFTVHLLLGCNPYDPPTELATQAGWKKVSDGEYTFSLKSGQSLSIELPEGVQATIDEDDYSKEGFLSMINVNGEEQTDPWNGTINTETNVEYINIKEQWYVTFNFQNVGEPGWTTLKKVSVPADTAVEDMLVKNNQVPELSEYPETVISDGQIYHRISWSDSEDLSDPHSLDQDVPLKDGEVFYGGYIPEQDVSLAVRKLVEGKEFDPERKYHFTAKFSYEGKPFDLSDSQVQSSGLVRQEAGVYSFDLLNEERTALQIPKGVQVSVSESEESSEGFETSLEVNKQEQSAPYSGILTDTTELDFINRKKQWNIEFEFKDAGSESFAKLSEVSVPADTSTESTLVSDHLVPGLDSYPENKIADGKVWHLVYWSKNTDLTSPDNLDNSTPLKDNEVFYAGYIPVSENKLSITKTVEGQVSDPERQYDINISLARASEPFDPSESAITDAGWKKTGTGQYQVSLKNGETSAISLPENSSVQIEEADYSQDGFESSLMVNGQKSGTPFSQNLTNDTNLEFINTKEQWDVSFYFQDAGSLDWDLLKTADIPADTSTQQTLLNMHLVPDLDKYPQTRVVNGMVYHLKFWSENKDLRNLTDLNSSKPLSDHEDFYVGYVADELKSLTISKQVDGHHLDKDRKFEFTISLEEQDKPFELSEDELKQAGWTKKADGTYTVSLEDSQSSTAVLPAGITWSIQEEDCSSLGYETSAEINEKKAALQNQNQVLNENSTIEFTNTKKQWEVGFMFRDPGSSVWKLMKKKDIPAETSTLKTLLEENAVPDLSTKPKIVIENGKIYRLKVWSENEDLEPGVNFDSDQKLKDHETFYAGYVEEDEYDLNFEKEVSGFDDTQKDFSFTAVFTFEGQPFDPSESLIQKNSLARQADGVYKFTAKAGKKMVFAGLPENVIVRIFENDYAADGYQTSIVKDGTDISGREVSVLINKNSDLKFINHRKAWTINFMLRDAAGHEYALLDSIEIPAESTVEDALVKAKDVPSLAKYPKTVVKDGKIWNLKFWSVHKNMSDAGNLDNDDPVYNGETFYAAYVPVDMETLTISKNVVSVIPDPDSEFEFRLQLTWKNEPFELSQESAEKFGLSETEKGIYTFKLKDNQEITDLPIPQGVEYQLEEVKTSGKLYKTSYIIKGVHEDGTASGFRSMDQDQRISFVNWEKTISVEFYLRNAAEPDFRKIDTVTLPGQEYTEKDLVERGQAPELSGLPEYQVINGKVYQIHYWSENQDMTDLTDLNSNEPVRDHEKFYAAYLPLNYSTLSVTNTVEGDDVNKDQKFSYVIRLSQNGEPFTECLTPLCNVQDTDYNVFNDLKLLEQRYSLKKQKHVNPDNPWGLKNVYDGVEVHNNGDGTYTFTLASGQSTGPYILPDNLDFEVEEIDGFTDGYGTSYQMDLNNQSGKWVPKDIAGPDDLHDQIQIHFLNVRNKENPAQLSIPDNNKDKHPETGQNQNQTGGSQSAETSGTVSSISRTGKASRAVGTSAAFGVRTFTVLGILALLLMALIAVFNIKRRE